MLWRVLFHKGKMNFLLPVTTFVHIYAFRNYAFHCIILGNLQSCLTVALATSRFEGLFISGFCAVHSPFF